MPSAEKCRLKIATYQDLRVQLAEVVKAEERYEITTRGGVGALEAALEQLMGIHHRIEADREKGEGDLLDDADYVLVKKYLAGDLGLLSKMVRTMRAQLPASKHRVEGMQRVLLLLDQNVSREEGKIRQAEMEEKEEAAYQRGLKERSNLEALESEEEQEAAPEELDSPEETPAAFDGGFCAHCSDPIEPPSGTKWCVPCASYKNRYEKLPPEHVLDARKKRKEERGADS